MKAIAGRMFALIHYRPWPTSTVVSYFEQIVIRRRLDASINAIDGAPRRHRRSSFPTRRPASFFPPPPLLSSPLLLLLVNYSTVGKQLYPFDRVNCIRANTRLGGIQGSLESFAMPSFFQASIEKLYKKRMESSSLVFPAVFLVFLVAYFW